MYRISVFTGRVRFPFVLHSFRARIYDSRRMKALLFTLVRRFEFELAVPAKDIKKTKFNIVQRPIVASEPDVGVQMPLLVKPYKSSV